jgi:hypothetical protein
MSQCGAEEKRGEVTDMVTRLAWMAAKLVSSKRETRYWRSVSEDKIKQ